MGALLAVVSSITGEFLAWAHLGTSLLAGGTRGNYSSGTAIEIIARHQGLFLLSALLDLR